MPECSNCGSYVTKRYVRVFAPPEHEEDGEVRACPQCTNIRDGADIRKARARNEGQVGDIK